MALKTGISTLALGALLFSSTNVLAQDFNGTPAVQDEATRQGFHGGDSDQWNDGRWNDGRWNDGRWNDGRWNDGQERWHDADAPSQQWNHNHTAECHHGPMPRPPARERGRYELQTVQRWVPARYEQVWVPEQCRTGHRGHTRCRGGYYEQRWVPGRYEQVQEWVWVRVPRWGGHRATPATYYP